MKRLTWMAMIVLTLVPAGLALACPSCKDSIPNTDAEQALGLPGGFNTSIYYMLIGLFVTIGLLIGVITKGVRSANRHMSRQQ